MSLFYLIEYTIKGVIARVGRIIIISAILSIGTLLVITINTGVIVFQKLEKQSLDTPKFFTTVDIRLQDPYIQGTDMFAEKKFTEKDFQDIFSDQRVRLINSHIYILANHITINGREALDQGIIKEIPSERGTDIRIIEGRNIQRNGEAIIGEDWLHFPSIQLDSKDVLGKTLSIEVPSFSESQGGGKYEFLIVGIEDKNDLDGDAIRISDEEAQNIYNTAKNIDIRTEIPRTNAGNIIAQLHSSQDVRVFSKEWSERGYYIQTSQDTLNLIQASYQKYQSYIYVASMIILIVIGFIIFLVMNLMVRERYREIGIMKALGARNSAVLAFYLIQGSILSLIGSTIGSVVFLGIIMIIRYRFISTIPKELSDITIDWGIIITFNVLFLIFAIAGSFFPAKKASSLDPIKAISSV